MIEYTREELIAICEAAIVPESEWNDRDSYGAQFQVGECWALLRAGCEFEILYRPADVRSADGCFTDEDTIWINTYGKGFQYFESHEPGDPDRPYMEEERHYLPTRKRLAEAAEKDWY